jgi:hypothetical protein
MNDDNVLIHRTLKWMRWEIDRLKLLTVPLATAASGGDVVGPAGATDLAIAKYSGITGKLIQNSLATVAAGGGINIPTGQTYNINSIPHTHASLWVWRGAAGPLTSTSWDGDAHSNEASTQLDLSAVFSVPANVKAVALKVGVRDSAAWGTDALSISIGPDSTYCAMATIPAFGGDVKNHQAFICSCDTNGDVWYEIKASGVNTFDVWIEVWGWEV